ncbi:MAG TPA: ABC transporter permease [Candidatus Acidoferrales bacterium]|nr:ABC transporter permease [Candidatus Acidoferrales bacterium]
MQTLLQDLKYGLRMLAKSPGFTAVAVLTLALGIGANTAIFSLIDAVMLRSLPVEDPSGLVVVKWSARKAPEIRGYMSAGDCPTDLRFGQPNPSGCSLSEPMFREMEQAKVFSGVAAFANAGRLDLAGNGPASVISGQVVSGDFFRTLGVKAFAGRVLQPSDDSPSAASVAVLNYGYWQSAFGGARDAIGRTIQMNGIPVTIVGVAEQRFIGITPGSDYDVWLPLAVAPRISNPARWRNRQDDVTFWWLTVVGRLKTEMPVAQAQATISGIFRNEMLHGSVPMFEAGGPMPGPRGGGPGQREMALGGGPAPAGGKGPMKIPPTGAPPSSANTALGQAPDANPSEPKTFSKPADEPAVTLVSAQTGLSGSRRQYANPLYVLMLAVGIILMIACANVAGLMLARSAARRKEMAVRLALGAGRTRIVRQLLTESVMLSVIGGVLGIFFAYWGAHAIVSFVSSNQTRALGFAAGVDMRVLGFTVAVSLITGILFGIAPAFRSARVDLTPTLKEGFGVSPSIAHVGGRWISAGNALVVAQVALAIVVLVGAGLLVRTLENLRSIDVGFDSHNVVIFNIDPTLAGYKDTQIDSFYRDLQGRLSETPGVKSVSYSSLPLLSGNLMVTSFHWPGAPQDRESNANMLNVGPDFFTTMQIPFLGGRGFNASDYALAASNEGPTPTEAPTPVIVNQAFVAKYLGKENPLGKRFGESAANDEGPKNAGYEIIGVVRDAKYNSLRQEISPTMYAPQSGSGATFEVRTAADPQALLPAIRRVVAQLNENLPLFQVTTESQQIDRLLFQERLVARLSAFFGLLALVLACIGLYGLLSYEVSRRTREIGIRMALGAQEGDVLRLVVKQGFALAVVGAAMGIGVALGVTRYLASMLYGVHANDPVTIGAVAVLLGLVALAACYIPARRATRVDPMVALRYE